MRCKSIRVNPWRTQSGVTLMELVVVMVILAAIAGLAITAVGSAAEDAREQTTRLTLANVRSAIDGPYRFNMGRLPESVADLLKKPTEAATFDPVSQHGWNGPYVRVPIARYTVGPVGTPEDPNWVDVSFVDDYGMTGDLAILDGYGKPIVLQIPDIDADDAYSPDERRHVRLVSAGLDGVIDTPRDMLFPTLLECDDDLVVYVVVADERE